MRIAPHVLRNRKPSVSGTEVAPPRLLGLQRPAPFGGVSTNFECLLFCPKDVLLFYIFLKSSLSARSPKGWNINEENSAPGGAQFLENDAEAPGVMTPPAVTTPPAVMTSPRAFGRFIKLFFLCTSAMIVFIYFQAAVYCLCKHLTYILFFHWCIFSVPRNCSSILGWDRNHRNSPIKTNGH